MAALTVVGAIIVDFDYPRLGPNYFNALDESGWNAAKAVFPDIAVDRLFKRFDVHEQARGYWPYPEFEGLQMLLTGLPAAIGYWDGEDDSAGSAEPTLDSTTD